MGVPLLKSRYSRPVPRVRAEAPLAPFLGSELTLCTSSWCVQKSPHTLLEGI